MWGLTLKVNICRKTACWSITGNENHKLRVTVHTYNPSTAGAEAGRCEFETTMDDVASSKLAKATWWDPSINKTREGDVAQLIECLSGTHNALGLSLRLYGGTGLWRQEGQTSTTQQVQGQPTLCETWSENMKREDWFYVSVQDEAILLIWILQLGVWEVRSKPLPLYNIRGVVLYSSASLASIHRADAVQS